MTTPYYKISHENSKSKVSFPPFLSWPPSIAHTLSYEIVRYVVLNGFSPLVRGGCISCSRRAGRIPVRWRCVPQALMPNAQSTFCDCLSSWPVWYSWLFLASMVFCGIPLSLVHVCIHFETPVLYMWFSRMVGCFSNMCFWCNFGTFFLASASECSFPAIWQCPGNPCNAICLYRVHQKKYLAIFNLTIKWKVYYLFTWIYY